MKIYDISRELYKGMQIYPNNEPFIRDKEVRESSVNSSLKLRAHTGTHIDPPLHAIPNGETIE